MKRSALPALIALATLSGCGKFLDNFSRLPGGFTKVVFNHDSQSARDLNIGLLGQGTVHANNVLNGGAIIYARNAQSGTIFSGTMQNEGGTLSLTLPNGDYSFSAVGWPDANLSDLSSNYVRCGTAPALTLSGQSQDVTFNLADTTACYNSADFAVSAMKSSPTIGTLMLNFCHQSTNLINKTLADYCQGVDLSSNFYAGNATTAKIDKVSYFSSSDTIMFTASHDSYQTSSSTPPTAPYELFRFDHSSGKQTKIPLALSGGYGVVSPQQPNSHNKLIFLVRNGSGPASLWSYNLSDGVFAQISQTPPSGTTNGVKEFSLSDDGNWVVFVGDMDTVSLDELYSVPIPADSVATFAAPTKISGALTGTGVAHCASCTGGNSYYFNISRGNASPYVAFAGATSASLTPLLFASMDGLPIPSTTIAGTPGSNTPSGIQISGGEIGTTGDYTDNIAFSPTGQYLIYHAHSGSYEKAMTVQVNYTPGTSLTVTAPVQIMQGITQPFFVTGASTTKAILFSGSIPGGNNTTTTVSVVDLTAPATTLYSLFNENGASGLDVSSNLLTQSDSVFVVAFQDHSTSNAVDLVSVSTISSSNLSTTPYSYTGGALPSPKQIKSISGSGNNFFRLAPGNTFSLLFISDKATTSTFQLWSASLAGAPVDSSGTGISSTVPVVSATYASNGSIYFAAPIDITGTNELYLSNPGSQPTRVGSSSSIGSIKDLGDSSDTGGLGLVLPLDAAPLSASGILQPFLYHTSTGVFEGMGRIGAQNSGSNPSGVGRVRITMLQANDGINFTPAFDSGCLSFTGATQDGQHLPTTVRVPTGTGGNTSPFATAIDVFPLGLDCSGPPQRHLLPNGIGTALDQVSNGVLLRANAGSGRVFIQDQ